MSLSHWDLFNSFTTHQAACLAAGVDPNLINLSDDQQAKIKTIEASMREAISHAESMAIGFGRERVDRQAENECIDSLFWGIEFGYFLVSIELRQAMRLALRSERGMNADDIPVDDSFSRKALDQWFKEKRFNSAYSFMAPGDKSSVQQDQTAKPLATTERNTLLTIIAALCDYSAIKHQERGAASLIAKLTEEIGAAVSDDAVRRALAKIPSALEARTK